MNELEKAYENIETWYYCAEQEGFAYENDILYLDYIKKHINKLQSKINKINQYIKHNLEVDEHGAYVVYVGENENELLDILKEDK
jgi:hypothetical protein